MMKYLQKLGKALMLPVAVLPICGILMGLGYALAPGVMGVPGAPTSGAAYTVGFLLVKAGGALIDNMAWLFAIGAAVGLADNDGTAGLAGLVSFLMMQQLLSPGVVGAVRTLEEGTVDYIAFSKIAGNSFIGILAAIIGAACYNKFKNTQLPDWLAFFSGKRFVAIATGLISILVSVVLLFVWPVIFDALVAIGNGIAGMGGIGAGIYAFLNRLLIPTGLHHALNNVFWFDTIGLGDLSHFWAGETSADVGWSLGMYKLSGGQKQRVAIARALISKPQIILADEPTGALDSKTSVEVMRILKELHDNEGLTIIIVTHESGVANQTNKIIHIKDGVIERIEDNIDHNASPFGKNGFMK